MDMHLHRLTAVLSMLCCIALTACGENKPQPLSTAVIPFSGESVMGSVGDEEYRYFRYGSVEAALVDKVKIAADGKRIGPVDYAWEGPVHIFHLAKRIVIYVGDDPVALAMIEKTFGRQIGGDPISDELREQIKEATAEHVVR